MDSPWMCEQVTTAGWERAGSRWAQSAPAAVVWIHFSRPARAKASAGSLPKTTSIRSISPASRFQSSEPKTAAPGAIARMRDGVCRGVG